MDWSGVDYLWIIVMFLSAVWTLILTAPIHCIHWWASDGMLHFSKSDEETNSSTSLMYLRLSTFSAHVHFWVNCSFKTWDALTCLPPRRWNVFSSCSCEDVVLTALRAGLLSAEALVVVAVGRAVLVFCLRVCSLARGMMSQLCGRCQTVHCVEALCSSRIGTFWSRKAPTTGPVRCVWSAHPPGRPKHTRPSAGWHTCAPGCAARWFPPIPT